MMARYHGLIFYWLLLLINIHGGLCSSSTAPRVGLAELQTLNYDRLHELAVLDQIEHHKPAYKSLDTRQVHSLNGLTSFCLDDLQQGFHERWFERDLRQACRQGNFYRLPIPSAFNDITSNATVRDYVGFFWYQFEFSLESLSTSTQVDWHHVLQFESVNYLAFVFGQPLKLSDGGAGVAQLSDLGWLKDNNIDTQQQASRQGKLLGSHVGGHLPFAVNLTSLISEAYQSAQDDQGRRLRQRFRISVAVSNLLTDETIPSGKLEDFSELAGQKLSSFRPDFDFFHFAGIMGSVNLLSLPPSHWTLVELARPTPKDMYNSSGLQFEACYASPTDISSKLGDARYLDELVSYSQKAPYGRKNNNNINDKTTRLIDARLLLGTSNKSTHQIEWLRGQVDDSRSGCMSIFFPDSSIEYGFGSETTDYNQLHQKHCVIQFNLIELKSDSTSKNDQASGTTTIDTYEMRLYDPRAARRVFKSQAYNNNNNNKLNGVNCDNTPKKMLQGFGMHEEQLFSGRSMSQASILKDLYLLKELGANVLRTSHYPYSRAYLEACDELGLLVVAESPAVGLGSFSQSKLRLHKQILLEMMQRDHEHVSVFAWSLANEPQSQKAESRAYFESLAEYARTELARYTSGRLLTAAIAQSAESDQIGHTLDLVMLNYYFAWYSQPGLLKTIEKQLVDSLGRWARSLPGKPLLISEFGADTLAGFHSLEGEIFSEEYQRDYLLEHERIFDQLWLKNCQSADDATPSGINFWGSMAWNFADFSTHSSLLRPAGNRKGLFDRARRPKLAYEDLKRVYQTRV